MQQTQRPLPWSEPQLQALALIFEGRLSQAEIAEKVSTPLRTFVRWLAHPDFRARLAEMRANLIESLSHVPYVRKEQRSIGLSEMAESARCEYEAHTLLIERRPAGRDSETGEQLFMEQEMFNRDAHAAFREALADIAAELGPRKNVTEFSGSVETREPHVVFYIPEPMPAPPEE